MRLGSSFAGLLAVIVLAGCGSTERTVRIPPLPLVSREYSTLLSGIPQSGDALGRPGAPVTLQMFGDLQSPVCRKFALAALPRVLDNWVRTGKLRIVYRSLRSATRDPAMFGRQQVAALAAGTQDRMWNYVELVYHEQGEENSGYVTEGYLRGIAEQIPGLNLRLWQKERSNPKLTAQVTADERPAKRAGFTETPSFLIGRTRRQLARFEPASLEDPASFNRAIQTLLGS